MNTAKLPDMIAKFWRFVTHASGLHNCHTWYLPCGWAREIERIVIGLEALHAKSANICKKE